MLAAIWNLYLGMLTLIGNTVLIFIGIGLCGYATMQQLQTAHDPNLDVILFVAGLFLLVSRMIRRIVWTVLGLGLVWIPLVWFGAQMLTEHDGSFRISQELIAIALAPPAFLTLLMEMTRKKTEDFTHLEITLSERTEKDP